MKDSTKKLIQDFNKPWQPAVAINTEHIGDDNDYACFLKNVCFKLWQAGEKEMALKLARTDSFYVEEPTKESFEESMLREVQFIKEEKDNSDAYAKCYRD